MMNIHLLEDFVKQQDTLRRALEPTRTLIDSVKASGALGSIGLAADHLQRHAAMTRQLDEVFGAASRANRIMEEARIGNGRLDSMLGFQAELESARVLDRWHRDMEEAQRRLESVSAVFDRLTGPTRSVLDLTRDLFESPAVRSLSDTMRLLERDRILGFDVLDHLHPYRGSSLSDLQPHLSLEALIAFRLVGDDDGSLLDEDLVELSDDEHGAIRTATEVVESVLGRMDELEQRLSQIGDAMERIHKLLLTYRGRPVIRHLLLFALQLLANVAATCISHYVIQAQQAVAPHIAPGTRPADVARDARRIVSGLDVPPGVLQVPRVVKHRSAHARPVDGGPERVWLPRGTVVEVWGQHGKWRLIRWMDVDTDEPQEGWARAKHLGRLDAR